MRGVGVESQSYSILCEALVLIKRRIKIDIYIYNKKALCSIISEVKCSQSSFAFGFNLEKISNSSVK